jgi:YesN/AraC family two-component response regulator
LTFTIGIGSIVEGFEDAPLSYQRALAATTQRFRLGPGRVVGEAARPSERAYRFPDDQAERLVRAVRAGEPREAISHLDEILDATRAHRWEDFLLSTHLLIHRLETLSIGNETRTGALPAVRHVRSRLGHFETIEEARRCFREVVRELCEAANSGSNRKREELARSIRQLIDKDLTDPNLGTKWLADRLSISTGYARSVFRDLMGISISDYINDSRLDRCKVRLGDGDVQVKELYREVGFGSYNYFFALFRRHTGMTPLQYKRRHGAETNS